MKVLLTLEGACRSQVILLNVDSVSIGLGEAGVLQF